MWRGSGMVLLALVLGACTTNHSMIVELRTELRAGYEFTRAEAEVFSSGAVPGVDPPLSVARPRAVAPSDDGLVGLRVGQLDGLASGDYLVRLRLFDADDNHAGSGLVLVALAASRVVTVIVNQDCRDVVCPGDGPPDAIACLDGRCVAPTCPEDPTTCPPPECAEDSECTAMGVPACVRGACLASFCVEYADDTLCSGSIRCDIQLGCRVPPAMDAGTRDAGMDAGADAGVDAGFDSGTDAGIRCSQVPSSVVNISFALLNADTPTWSAVDRSCSPTGQTPHFTETIYCNERTAPYGFSLEIVRHPTIPTVTNPTIWGFAGAGVPPTGGCTFVTSGVGSITPYQLLLPGEYFTLRVGSTQTGSTGNVSAQLTP